MQVFPVTKILPRTVALLPGSFHPVTVAHLAMAHAALAYAEAVWLTLPRSFPHKSYDSVTLDDRLRLVAGALDDDRLGVAVSEGGLFIEMAHEARRRNPRLEKIYMVCGRDAAERIVNWGYDGIDPIEEQLQQYELLVAAREGEFQAPAHLASRIHPLPMPRSFDEVSASRLREEIRRGGDWEHLTPPAVRDAVRQLYGSGELAG